MTETREPEIPADLKEQYALAIYDDAPAFWGSDIRELIERIARAETREKRLEDALTWMSKNRALTIFIETEDHVADFFAKCDAALERKG